MKETLTHFTENLKCLFRRNADEREEREEALLLLRNGFVCIAAILFLISLLPIEKEHLLRGIAYFFGALAYFSEVLIMTDVFSEKPKRSEIFMAVCFAPLYVLMGLSYLLHH